MGTLHQALSGVHAILLDFDGPVCNVFAGYPADAIAHQLRRELYAAQALPEEATDTDDPMQILRAAAIVSPEAGRQADELLAAAEAEAVSSAQATPGADDLLQAVHAQGLGLAIVSNNTADAIGRYLARQQLAHLVPVIVGRDTDPRLMKPDPTSLTRALAALSCEASAAVMIGDSTTDIDAARAAGTRSIGYANKPGKAQRLTDAGATAVITSMRDVAQAVTAGTAELTS